MSQSAGDSTRKPGAAGGAAGARPRAEASSRATPTPSDETGPATEYRGSNGASSGSHPPTLEDLQGRQIGEFQMIRRLGHGGMAEVYLAEQTSLKRNVAVKVLRGEALGSDDVLIKRFEQEAKAAGSLNHPNIIQVYAIGSTDGIYYIAQEYVQGMNLREFLSKRGVPDVSVALHIMRQVAAALEAAAEAGIVHRDIKPENIMITRKGGKVKVADFGLAQVTRKEAGQVNLTQVGMTMGTPLYMSPEQVNGSKVDQRSDVYSFGVTCFHMLTGQPPFKGPTAMSIAVQHLKEEPPSLQERRPDLPPALCQIVHRMMAKDPEKRYPSAQAVSSDLKKLAKLVKEQPEAAAEMSLSEPASARQGFRPPGWAVRHPLAAFLVACGLVSTASAGVGWLMRPSNPFRAPPPEATREPRESSASAQYFRAKQYFPNSLEAWQAVISYFPSERQWTQRAQAEIAFLYLKGNRQSEARAIFTDLAAVTDDDSVSALGYAGLAVIQNLEGQYFESQKIIHDNLQRLRQRLPPDVDRLLREVSNRNRVKLQGKGFESLFPPEHGEGEPGA
ncbi:MAG: serine/threonine protein kinase [Planctomycetaceae bacterium]|nr:serine/threonine protein kinase [Planctomycetaceae bacterium]